MAKRTFASYRIVAGHRVAPQRKRGEERSMCALHAGNDRNGGMQVEVLWQCTEAKLEGSINMKRQKGPAPLYSAQWTPKVSCGPPKAGSTNVITLQVKFITPHLHAITIQSIPSYYRLISIDQPTNQFTQPTINQPINLLYQLTDTSLCVNC